MAFYNSKMTELHRMLAANGQGMAALNDGNFRLFFFQGLTITDIRISFNHDIQGGLRQSLSIPNCCVTSNSVLLLV